MKTSDKIIVAMAIPIGICAAIAYMSIMAPVNIIRYRKEILSELLK